MYDTDKSLTIDDTTFTIALTHATNDGLTVTGGASSAGDCIQITNSGSGYDIRGTSNTWGISKGGSATVTGIVMVDGQKLVLGTSSDAVIQWVGASNYVDIQGATNFDGNAIIETGHNLTMTNGTFTMTTGDAVMSDGSLTLTDADNATSMAIINNTITSGNLVGIEGSAVTTGSMLYINQKRGTLSGAGSYINCNDDGTSDFVVGIDGATDITSAVATTKALRVTGVQTSEHMVTFDNTGGVVANDKAVLLLDEGGNAATGSNVLRIEMNGTPLGGAIGEEIKFKANTQALRIDGAGIATGEAIWIDADPTGTSAVYVHSDGAQADNKALLELHSRGANVAGSNVLRVDQGSSTAKTNAIAIEIITTASTRGIVVDGAGRATGEALWIDSDATGTPIAYIHSDGATANDKALLSLHSQGAAVTGSNILRIQQAASTSKGGAIATEILTTALGIGLKIDGDGKATDYALYVDADPTGTALAYFHRDATATRAPVIKVHQDHSTGGSAVLELIQDDADKPLIRFGQALGSGTATITSTNKSPGGGSAFIMIDINSSIYWIPCYKGTASL